MDKNEQMAFWELCKRSNSSPQLINKYQKLKIVTASPDRKRGLRQIYDSGAFGEIIAANFLKAFFSLQEVAEIRKLENQIRESWLNDEGKVFDRTGDDYKWDFFFTKELRFSFVKNWEKSPTGTHLKHAFDKYLSFRTKIVECLKPMGDDSYLKRALNPISLDKSA